MSIIQPELEKDIDEDLFLEPFPYQYFLKGMSRFEKLRDWDHLKFMIIKVFEDCGGFLTVDNSLIAGYSAQCIPDRDGYRIEISDDVSELGYIVDSDECDAHNSERTFNLMKEWVSRFSLPEGYRTES